VSTSSGCTRRTLTWEHVIHGGARHQRTQSRNGSVCGVAGTTRNDDRNLLVSATSGAGQLWDVATGQQIGPNLPTEPGTVPSVAPGRTIALVTAGADSTLLWNLDVTTWTAAACTVAGRNMTAAEWKQFGPRDEPYRATCERWPLPDPDPGQ
jgi:WD40 repeat protein